MKKGSVTQVGLLTRDRVEVFAPLTHGLLCDAAHPALKNFPTATHAEWQWRYRCKNSRPMPPGHVPHIKPFVGVADNFFKIACSVR